MWILFIALGLAHSSLEDSPEPPLWPDVFTQTFNESWWYQEFGTVNTTGTYYYDWTSQMLRIDRANGRYDEYCGLVGFRVLTNAPCTHYVVEGNRFLYYPNDDTCCFCCNEAQDCGMLKPTWLENARFTGSRYTPQSETYTWNLQNIDYFESANVSPSKRVMESIYQGYTESMTFHNITYKVPEGIFTLPNSCSLEVVCPEISKCTAARRVNN